MLSIRGEAGTACQTKRARVLGGSTSGYYTWIRERDGHKEHDETIRNKVLELFWKEGNSTYVA